MHYTGMASSTMFFIQMVRSLRVVLLKCHHSACPFSSA
ncbi:hypothetical protein OE903_08430 [Bacillus sp. B6(2022)]|nr:hypothetical protein [Bacillus sp. B6(2022)]